MNPDTATVITNIIQLCLAVLGVVLVGQVRSQRKRRKLYTHKRK